MVIKSFLTERHGFTIAKAVIKNKKADLMGNYRQIYKKAIILSLLLVLILFQLFPAKKQSNMTISKLQTTLEVIDIPNIIYEEPPPPMVQQIITSYPIIVKEEPSMDRDLRKNLEEVKLELNVKANNNLLTGSQFDISHSGLISSYARYEKGVALNINSELNKFRNPVTDNNPDFNLGTRGEGKKYVENSVELETPSLEEPPKINNNQNVAPENDSELLQINKNQFLLRESESTIGTHEYRLWNKINAALDRLDKNRFGKLPANVQRTTAGLAVSFLYNNGLQHEIFWSKGGKVVIRITGSRPRQISDELERAFDSLISLTL